ncbi:hypothetical protein KP509_28G037300 [Ceratopteris richardii]|uniref:Pentatricopeptide repeat-containing protein n=1 Tax=Ceratopteris richardii TaxID=49495 RepID=A0A8T2RBA6_CERRI|nr:hypothetical protein KP509_28G037300 [Ceratopteris richardii]
MPITIDKLYSTGNRSKDLFVLASLLRRQGKAKILVNVQYIHAQIITFGHESDTYLCNCLIQGYGDCGAVKEAQACFNAFNSNTFSWTLVIKAFAANGFLTEAMALFRMNPYKDVVTWNSTIAFLVKSDRCREALALFYEMPQEGIEVNNITFLCVIDSCIKLNSIDDGQRVCSIIETSRFRQNLVVCSALIKMFSKWGFVDKAREIFHSLPTRDVVLYTTMISMYAKLEDLVESLYLFQQMLALDMKTDVVLYVSLLDMCTTLRALDEGKQIHFILEVDNLAQNVMLATALINFYGKNTRVDDAEAVFEHQRQRDVVFLNAMITAYEQNNHGEKALILFHKLYVWHINPSIATFLCVLDACSSLSVLEEGKLIHSAITFEGASRRSRGLDL